MKNKVKKDNIQDNENFDNFNEDCYENNEKN